MGFGESRACKRAGYRKAFCPLAALLSCLAGCGSNEKPLRLGLNAWPGYEFLHLAEVRGFYKQRGVDVQLVEFGSLSDARLALERDQVDGLQATQQISTPGGATFAIQDWGSLQ
jgi:ABC-type nitrate/sulfonate/bicarbonate transport system substrate-binding protein